MDYNNDYNDKVKFETKTNVNNMAVQQRGEEGKKERQRTELQKERFARFGIAGTLYTLLYTFCLYRNTSGITYPFFVAGTFYFYYYCMKKSRVTAKKDSFFYIIATVLLGVSNALTGDGRMIMMNRIGIFLLTASFLIHQFYEDITWSFPRYFGSICRLVFGAVKEIFSPYQDFFSFLMCREKKKDGKIKYAAIGVGIGLPLVYVVLCLLSSADLMFEHLFTKKFLLWIRQISIWDNMFGILWKLFIGFGIGYGVFAFLEKRSLPVKEGSAGKGEPLVGVIVTAMLAAVYLLFCGVQIIGLFGGMVRLPEGYSYARYARQGFFQLLFVCFLNLILVLFCMGYFRESKALKLLLTIISLCTYVMTASSAFRMILYIRAYYLTFLRILVLWALMVIAVLMTGVLVRIYKKDFELFRYSTAVVTVFYLVLSFSHPDYWAAKYNLAQKYFDDWQFLYTLTSDAAPAFYDAERYSAGLDAGEAGKDAFAPEQKKWYEKQLYRVYWEQDYWQEQKKNAQKMGIRSFNISRFISGHYAERVPMPEKTAN